MLFRRRKPQPIEEVFLAGMDLEELERINRNLNIVLQLMDIADLAALSFSKGDYDSAFKALMDYHAVRQEHAEPIVI